MSGSSSQASNEGGLDEALFGLVALLVVAALALIGFAYVHRLSPVIVGVMSLFVMVAHG